jgi:hypothetical protein
MPAWMWLNVVLGALFVLAIVGVPLWMVIARPDTGPQRASASPGRGPRTSQARRPVPHASGSPAGVWARQPARGSRAGVS